MGLKAGIIGLPNAGKSTIFNALTQSGIPAENYPFCTIDPNVGIVNVPDFRLNELAEVFQPKENTPATMEFVDIAGLVKGASHGEGLGNQFLSHIRDVDAVIHVVRLFEDNNVSHVEGSLDPIRDIEIVETELLLRDISSVEKRMAKLKKTVRIGDKESSMDLAVLEFILPQMNEGVMVHDIVLENNQRKRINQMALLSAKPVLYIANVDEDEILAGKRSENIQQLFDFAEKRYNVAIRLCGNLEAEIATLPDKEKPAFLLEYNLPEAGLDKLIHASYNLLGLETFFTAGDKQVRAWTIKKNTPAHRAAGEIHTDMERGFIKAEIYACAELVNAGSELSLREAGKIRQEGKNYIVQDGDVIFFKFNV
jgi:GTP-binding protein YchF